MICGLLSSATLATPIEAQGIHWQLWAVARHDFSEPACHDSHNGKRNEKAKFANMVAILASDNADIVAIFVTLHSIGL